MSLNSRFAENKCIICETPTLIAIPYEACNKIFLNCSICGEYGYYPRDIFRLNELSIEDKRNLLSQAKDKVNIHERFPKHPVIEI